MATEPGGAVYAEYIDRLCVLQDEYKASLEVRALSVITSSATLATLLLGLVAVITRAADFRLPLLASVALVLALASFAVGAVLAITVNAPRDYKGVQVDPLRVAVRDEWSVAVSDARQKIALTQVDVLDAAKTQNRSKATALQRAIRAEAIAIACLAACVALILAGR